ncbi:MAG: transporter [Piscirickettsiaceae bacterium CG_4_9_14_3_um_filter_43_564]|nr:TolC family protein [Thiomicrospira sp.]PIQ05154.1 MAG: transporter [Piscirickettsiaceae bacterium CG18_big_fil_WC_8_21_14_2_50_44_103]PIU37744.1 MAG: transporter [Piscirickettsiaceae bacterium CG07_land_8_20_14_0_80_44_28]PIW58485.1 MAG: transporter [Piscirickettsiaceae bacterium CG12_big_fil_rev_8_21_14_0_65_44_934]PIW77580.1 MAG: transporter [Piscirickettsiaceae bacterium CG_4_8_14_3_um_filter_44_38]PIX80512.1 MAG: transporter [Piscirickettsiaceae bacterium CG_4_10_14_3_um_filter_44_349]
MILSCFTSRLLKPLIAFFVKTRLTKRESIVRVLISLLRGRRSLMVMFLSSLAVSAAAQETLTLQRAIDLALKQDPWLQQSQYQQLAKENRSIAASALPDPRVSVGLISLPTDTFNLNQENMTQLQVGISQVFPRGDSLAIKQAKLHVEATAFPLLRTDRKAKLKSRVTQLWLDAFLAQKTIDLINQDRDLFEQMTDIAQVSYSSVSGRTRQYDVIRADLELIQLEDRLTVEQQKLEIALAKLGEWVLIDQQSDSNRSFDLDVALSNFRVSEKRPEIDLLSLPILELMQNSNNELVKTLSNHPAILAIDVKHQASRKTVELAKQSYKPQWGLNASYGIRGNNPSGIDRANLLSIGMSFNVPIFTDHLQDRELAASVADADAVKTEKLLLMRSMLSALKKETQQLQRLSERQKRYSSQLLKQARQQAEVSLTAYTHDDGDFSEVVGARITELNARIASLKIDVDALKTIARINYFFTDAASNGTTSTQQDFGE